jgi:hypothetical protein
MKVYGTALDAAEPGKTAWGSISAIGPRACDIVTSETCCLMFTAIISVSDGHIDFTSEEPPESRPQCYDETFVAFVALIAGCNNALAPLTWHPRDIQRPQYISPVIADQRDGTFDNISVRVKFSQSSRAPAVLWRGGKATRGGRVAYIWITLRSVVAFQEQA